MTLRYDCSSTAALWDNAADGWENQIPTIRLWLNEATDTMLDMAGIVPGMRVLDVAAGTGDQALEIAHRTGRSEALLLTDVSSNMLRIAALKFRQAGYAGVQTLTADTASLGLDGENFDAAVCRLGLMFSSDPQCSLRNVRRALRPGARFSALVFSEPRMNACVTSVVSIAMRYVGLSSDELEHPGSLMSLGRPGLLQDLFDEAGFVDISVERVNAPFKTASAEHYLAFLRAGAAPIVGMLNSVDAQLRQIAWAEICAAVDVFSTETGWEAGTELLIVAGAG